MLSALPSCGSTLRPTSRKLAAWLLRPLPTLTLRPDLPWVRVHVSCSIACLQ